LPRTARLIRAMTIRKRRVRRSHVCVVIISRIIRIGEANAKPVQSRGARKRERERACRSKEPRNAEIAIKISDRNYSFPFPFSRRRLKKRGLNDCLSLSLSLSLFILLFVGCKLDVSPCHTYHERATYLAQETANSLMTTRDKNLKRDLFRKLLTLELA